MCWIPDALSLELGFWIPIVGEITDSLNSIPDSKAQDSGFQLDREKFSEFRNPDSFTWGERKLKRLLTLFS